VLVLHLAAQTKLNADGQLLQTFDDPTMPQSFPHSNALMVKSLAQTGDITSESNLFVSAVPKCHQNLIVHKFLVTR